MPCQAMQESSCEQVHVLSIAGAGLVDLYQRLTLVQCIPEQRSSRLARDGRRRLLNACVFALDAMRNA